MAWPPEFTFTKNQEAMSFLASSDASTSITAAGRKYAQVNSSARVQRTVTGLPTACAKRRRLDRRFAGVLAAEAVAEIGGDHAHGVFLQMKRIHQFAAHAERVLRAGPDRQFAVAPLGHRGARFHRHVLHVGRRDSFAAAISACATVRRRTDFSECRPRHFPSDR